MEVDLDLVTTVDRAVDQDRTSLTLRRLRPEASAPFDEVETMSTSRSRSKATSTRKTTKALGH